jgi:hypothetical protein
MTELVYDHIRAPAHSKEPEFPRQRLSKRVIIDSIVGHVTNGVFTGDKRDGVPPPITLQSFTTEMHRYGAKALRARLSRLTLTELCAELKASVEHIAGREEYVKAATAQLKREDRDADMQAHSERQRDLAKRPRLQSAILATARHYRGLGLSAGEAWDAIGKIPFTTDDGHTVEIEGSKLSRLKQRMRVRQADGRQRKRAISFAQWRKSYWTGAKPG